MIKKTAIIFLSSIIMIASCKEKKYSFKKTDTVFIDSIVKNSDSSYTKPYFRTDFVTADYYISKKDAAVTQIMRDSAKQIRQIVISKKNIRTYFAQYFPNGQLQADLKLDAFGQFTGPAIYYYENGAVKSSGKYSKGLSTGEWREFDESGNVTAVLKYDSNGVRIN